MVKKFNKYFCEQKMISLCSDIHMDQKSQSQLMMKASGF